MTQPCRKLNKDSSYAANSAPRPACAGLFSYHFVHIYRARLQGRISAPAAASINTAMKGVVSELTHRKEDDCDDEFKGGLEEASRGPLQAGSARVRWSKGDDRIRSRKC